MREKTLAALLVAAAALIAKGAFALSPTAGYIAAGVLTALLAWLFLGDL